MSLQVHTLDEAAVRDIYHQHMVHDFPRDELKPLQRILASMRKGTGEFTGCYEASELRGYAFCMRCEDCLLLDYFAVVREHRNRGLGSRFMQELLKKLSDGSWLICQIDDPAFAQDEASRSVMLHRQAFYIRCGFKLTGVKVTTFGVPFLLLESPDIPHTPQIVSQMYAAHYQAMLPGWLFRKAICIPEY